MWSSSICLTMTGIRSLKALDPDGLRRLCGAILYRALQDAQAGDAEALDWLLQDEWAEALVDVLDLEPDLIRERIRELTPVAP